MPYAAFRFRRSITAQAQWVASAVIAVTAFVLGALTIAGAFGLVPVLQMPLQIGETLYDGAGLAIQAGVALFLLAIVACLPGGYRTLALERTHRDFAISMSDVAEAYRVCHAADRQEVFTLREQFDAVKERMRYLRAHPDLGNLEPDVIEAAAEMSFASRELAETYNEANVARARNFLIQRQQEIAQFEVRLKRAKTYCQDLKRQREAILMTEADQAERITELSKEFGPLLEELGFKRVRANVVELPAGKSVAAE